MVQGPSAGTESYCHGAGTELPLREGGSMSGDSLTTLTDGGALAASCLLPDRRSWEVAPAKSCRLHFCTPGRLMSALSFGLSHHAGLALLLYASLAGRSAHALCLSQLVEKRDARRQQAASVGQRGRPTQPAGVTHPRPATSQLRCGLTSNTQICLHLPRARVSLGHPRKSIGDRKVPQVPPLLLPVTGMGAGASGPVGVSFVR